jgi:putative transposase
MGHPYELKANDVHAYTIETLKTHMPIEAHGYICHMEIIWNVVIKASAESNRLEAVCADLEEVADSNTIREYLNAALPLQELRTQEEQVNEALAGYIPDDLVRNEVEVAMDFHDEPFYGKQEATRQVTCNGQAKKGTTHFVRIATAYIIWRQVRLTLAVRYVLPEEKTLEILKFLLKRLQTLGFQAKILYLDKGFATTDIIRYLTAQQQPAIIACPIRGKNGGTRALCRGRSNYSTQYTFTDGTPTRIAMKASLAPDASGKLRRKWLALIVVELDWKPDQVYQEYRRRFGIECSYRSLRRIRASTTSRNPALHFFLLRVGLILLIESISSIS